MAVTVDERSKLLDQQPRQKQLQPSSSSLATDEEAQTSNRGTGQDDTGPAEATSTAQLLVIMPAIWLICFPVAMDMTIMATLSVPISNSFDSLSLLSWLISSYLIATAAFQPISGGFTNAVGQRNALSIATAVFLLGNLLCGTAPDQWTLLLGRVVAGIGGGCINTITTIITTNLVPLKHRGIWQGYAYVSYGIGTACGGPFGGWIDSVWGWRWAFLAQVPFIFLFGLVAHFTIVVPSEDRSSRRRIDFLGAFLLVASLVLLLVGLNSGGNTVAWSHPLVWVAVVTSGLVLAAFVHVEYNVAEDPIIPIKVLINPTAIGGCLMYWFGSMAYIGFLHFAPIFVQVTGRTVPETALFLMPTSLGIGLGSLGGGYVLRLTDRRRLVLAGLLAVYLSGAVLFLVRTHQYLPPWVLYLVFFIFGFGQGSMLTVIFLALIASVQHKHHAAITSAGYAFRSTGSVLGVTLSALVFQNVLKSQLWHKLGDLDDAAGLIRRIRRSLDYAQALPEPLRSTVLDIYRSTLSQVAATVLSLCILMAACGLLIRKPIRT